MTDNNCRECRAGRAQALEMDIAWRCMEHGIQRLDQQRTIRSHPDVLALVEAAKETMGYLMRVPFQTETEAAIVSHLIAALAPLEAQS